MDDSVFRLVEDRWVYNRYDISLRMGYRCGVGYAPVGSIIKPMVNLYGMGGGVKVSEGEVVIPGYFWQEMFEGDHFSVDWENGRYKYTVLARKEGFRVLGWEVVNVLPDFSFSLLGGLITKYPNVNAEFIGDKLIEVHLRANPDFMGGHKRLDVVYAEDREDFISSPDNGEGFAPLRLGFKTSS